MEKHQLDVSPLMNLTYPTPRIKDFTLDDNLPELEAADNDHIFKPPKTTLGALNALPLELLHMVLSPLDLHSLLCFKRVNRRAMQTMESIPHYKTITTHARSAFRGILTIGRGPFITCDTLYDKLCTAECEECGDFGGYLYIITCKRVCFLCFTEDQKYLPLSFFYAVRKFGIDGRTFNSLPLMRSVVGTYSPNEKKCNKQSTLVDFDSAFRAGVAQHGSVSSMERYVLELANKRMEKYHERLGSISQGTSTQTPRRPRSPNNLPFDGRSGNPARFKAIVRTPWLNVASQKLEWGFHCIGCQKCNRCRPMYWRRKFTLTSFSKHLKECGTIRDGKHHLS